jgi:hypothetical protein
MMCSIQAYHIELHPYCLYTAFISAVVDIHFVYASIHEWHQLRLQEAFLVPVLWRC